MAGILAKSYDSSIELTTEELVVLHGYYREAYFQVFREGLYIARGVYSDRSLPGFYRTFAGVVFSTRYGRAWWQVYKDLLPGRGTVERIEVYLAENPPVPSTDRLRQLDEALQKENQ